LYKLIDFIYNQYFKVNERYFDDFLTALRIFNLIERKIYRIINTVFSGSNYTQNFNYPISFRSGDWFVSERIIEIAYVHHHIDPNGKNKRLLEFGCTKSDLALQVASLGYKVIGIDLREYKFTHPNFKFFKKNILDYEDEKFFDYITAISTLEHIGLSHYDKLEDESYLSKVANKLYQLLKPNGKLIATVPFGQEYKNKFYRSFIYDEIQSLFNNTNLKLVDEHFYSRQSFKFWKPCNLEEAKTISNSSKVSGPVGVNCVGCFVWEKIR